MAARLTVSANRRLPGILVIVLMNRHSHEITVDHTRRDVDKAFDVRDVPCDLQQIHRAYEDRLHCLFRILDREISEQHRCKMCDALRLKVENRPAHAILILRAAAVGFDRRFDRPQPLEDVIDMNAVQRIDIIGE